MSKYITKWHTNYNKLIKNAGVKYVVDCVGLVVLFLPQ